MKIKEIKEIEYDDFVYTPQVKDNENYLFSNGCLSKNCQNMSKATTQLVLSRIDNTCKIVILGSNRQIDNQYINRHTNGMTALLKSTEEKHNEVNLFAVELKKVLRGPITEFAEKLFSYE